MLTILGKPYRLCDGVSRRAFLKIGGLAMGGLSLPQILEAQSQSASREAQRSVIMIFLSGGAPHQDMYDLKRDAPAEVRGEFQPIDTAVPGIQICELLPRMAATMDRMAIIRSVVGSEGLHSAFQCMTGWPTAGQPQGGWPSFGAVVSKLQGPTRLEMPPFVGLSPKMRTSTWADAGQPGFLGAAHAPFKPNADGRAEMTLQGISLDRFDDRKALLGSFDRFRRAVDAGGAVLHADVFQRQALEILTSSRLADALDLEKEDPAVRDRYGRGSAEPAGYGDAGPLLNDYFLAARRLVEAGVRVVTLAYGRWDWHGRPHGTNFENARDHFPALDRALTVLLDDLESRGLDRDVSVVVWGEFGRTPRINKNGGRDHWPQVSSALLAGGGMRTGQVIGATNRLGEYAKERPVHFQEVLATLYRNLGIDINTATVTDLSGRPRYLVDHNLHQPMPELV
jgi:hypothetical protein